MLFSRRFTPAVSTVLAVCLLGASWAFANDLGAGPAAPMLAPAAELSGGYAVSDGEWEDVLDTLAAAASGQKLHWTAGLGLESEVTPTVAGGRDERPRQEAALKVGGVSAMAGEGGWVTTGKEQSDDESVVAKHCAFSRRAWPIAFGVGLNALQTDVGIRYATSDEGLRTAVSWGHTVPAVGIGAPLGLAAILISLSCP